MNKQSVKRLPSWLVKKLGQPSSIHKVKSILRSRNLHTVCESARCPNIGECFSKPTATFMILGNVCTRKCGFCSVDKDAAPFAVNPFEPQNIALTAKEMNLRHVVVTSVTRDDLKDFGSRQFALTIRAIKDTISAISVEVLTPDFRGDKACLKVVMDERPHIFNHNLETVPSLYNKVRPQADYRQSLRVIEMAKELSSCTITKSGLMVGFGETKDEVKEVLRDLKSAGCDSVTIGQYLRPTKNNLEVKEYIEPDIFKEYEDFGKEIGFEYVYSGPFVRSSYNAEMQVIGKGQ